MLGNVFRHFCGTAVMALLLWSAPAVAGQFTVSPVKVSLPAAAKSTTVTLTNNGSRTTAVRVRLYTWTKQDGRDRLTPDDELVVTPPIVRMEPGASQLVRIGRPSDIPVPEIEKAYRLVVTQLPIEEPAERERPGVVLRPLLEISVPVFVPPARPSRDLHWSLVRTGADAWAVEVHNAGTAHSKITALQLLDPSGQAVARHEGLFYSLPRHTSRQPLALARPIRTGEVLQLEFRMDFSVRRTELKVP